MLALAFLSTLAVLHTDGAYFRDSAGAAVLLRGVDVSSTGKVPPFHAITDATQLDPLPALGVNVLRLVFTWEAYEPTPGAFDDAYLGYYVGVIDAAASRGLYVIVDFHQDGYSRASLGGCGEGFPLWAIPPTINALAPDNGAACANWTSRLVSDADQKPTWDAFYADSYGVRTSYLTMIARVASALGARDNVIGYDMLNEPYGDEATQIEPLYEDAAKALRSAQPTAVLFVSPGYLTSAGTPSHLPRPTFDNLAYAPHFYDPTLVLLHSWQGNDESAVFAQMSQMATSWNAPLFLGEWGAPAGTDEVGGFLAAIGTQLDLAFASAAQWNFAPNWTPTAKDGWNVEDLSIVDDTGRVRDNFVVRPYARRIGGTPSALTVNAAVLPQQRTLTLSWMADPATGVTEIFAPPSWFGGDEEISASDGSQCTRVGDIVTCATGNAGANTMHIVASAQRRCGLTGLEGCALLALVRRLQRRRRRDQRPKDGP